MAFDAEDFLTLADLLASREPTEASLRTAVGRAYYPVFLKARERLQVTGRRRIHPRVIAALKRVDRSAGDQLDRLEQMRGYADYDLEPDKVKSWDETWHRARTHASNVLERIP